MQERMDRTRVLMVARERVGKPTQEEVVSIMQEMLPQMQIGAVKDYLSNGEGLGDLSEFKSETKKSRRIDLSRAALCASFVLTQVGMSVFKLAEERFMDEDLVSFRFNFDFAAGVNAAAGIVLSAEEEIAGEADELRERLTLSNHPSAGEGANQYLNMINEDRKSAELLKKDPTGVLLIDDLIKRVEKETSPYMTPFQVKEYFLAGATTARDLYTRLYLTTAPLYPDKEP